MLEVGAFEAKTYLSALLDKVDGGQEITMNKTRPLLPHMPISDSFQDSTVPLLFALRKGLRLNGLNWKELRDEGISVEALIFDVRLLPPGSLKTKPGEATDALTNA